MAQKNRNEYKSVEKQWSTGGRVYGGHVSHLPTLRFMTYGVTSSLQQEGLTGKWDTPGRVKIQG